jgi:spoIIIJ-associated protein
MAEIEVEGKTVEEAINTGIKDLGCSRDKVEIKILNEGTSGLFGLMGNKPARVLLTTKEKISEGASPEADFPLTQVRAKEVTGDILKLMGIKYTSVNTALMAGRILIDVKTPESNLVIGKNGQTLEAIENILNLILSREPKTRVKVSLDAEEYRRQQEEHLEGMAIKAAEQVTTTGKIFRFDPMPARSRRIIHLALKNNSDVETFSEGDGLFRKVGIKPKHKQK